MRALGSLSYFEQDNFIPSLSSVLNENDIARIESSQMRVLLDNKAETRLERLYIGT